MAIDITKEYNQLEDEIATWKIFIEIMQDEYFTLKSELNKIIGKKKLRADILKYLENLQTNILENEESLMIYKKSLLDHFEKMNILNENNPVMQISLLDNHQLLRNDEENVKQNLVELKKSFSEFIHLINDKKLV